MSYKIALIFLPFCSMFIGYTFAQKKDTFFEGSITYSIEYTPLKKEVTTDYLEQYYGTQLIYTIKNGFIKKSYLDKKGDLLQTRVFDPTTYLNSRILPHRDTVDQYHTYKNDFTTLEYNNRLDTIIDGTNLEGVNVRFVDKHNSKPFAFWYYFDKKLKVDPKYFSKFYEGEWNKIIAEKKAISTYFVIDNGYLFVARYKAIRVERKVVDSKIYDIPKELAIKNID